MAVLDECDLDKNVFPLTQWRDIALGPDALISDLEDLGDTEIFSRGEPVAHQKAVQRLLVYNDVVYAGVLCRALNTILDWEKDRSNDVLIKQFARRRYPPSYLWQIQRLLKCCDKRRLAVLKNGMLSLVPVHAGLEDLVFLLPGAYVPFLFRQQGDRYLFIGECYVQGIMFGEAWDEKSEETLETLIVE